MIFKGKTGEKPGHVYLDGKLGAKVGVLDNNGCVEVKNELYIARMKIAGYKEAQKEVQPEKILEKRNFKFGKKAKK